MARQGIDVLAQESAACGGPDNACPPATNSCGLGISAEECYADQAIENGEVAMADGEDNADG